jgi:4,5-DOPA dioxygenase extradiol
MVLREEGILILSGGLTAHNLRDRSSFAPDTAHAVHKEFDRAIHEAVGINSVGNNVLQENMMPDLLLQAEERKQAMFGLTRHAGFRESQPREDHFVPLYVAAGAGEGGEVRTILDLYGLASFAFGVQ